MADRVPTSGPWQTDPTVQYLLSRAKATGQAARGSQTPQQIAAWRELTKYIDANRPRLGIPDNYTINPRTGELYDPNQNQLRDMAITGGSLIGGGYAAGALMGGGQAAAGAGSGAAAGGAGTTGMVAPGIPAVAGTGAGVTAPLGGVTAAASGGAAAGGGSMLERLKSSLSSANGISSLASLIPMLAMAGGGNNSGTNGPGSEELRRIQAITEARMRRADPLHQVAVQLAYGRAPVSARQGVDLNNVRLPE